MGLLVTKSEKRAVKLFNAVSSGRGMAQVAKEMGIPYSAAAKIMMKYKHGLYRFQQEAPWHGWCTRGAANG